MKKEIKNDVQILWDYLCLNTENKQADCIIGLGNIFTAIPKKCAELYKQGLGDYIVFTGNCGKGTEGVITRTEAEIFKDIAIKEGVPEDKIFVETRATNTYENFKYTKELLIDENLNPNSFLIVGKPYQEKRALAIADVELPTKEYSIASFNMELDDFLDYVNSNNLMTDEDVTNEIVGEININIVTPPYGLQNYQEIPGEVIKAYNNLISLGFDQCIITDEIIQYVQEKWLKEGQEKSKSKKI